MSRREALQLACADLALASLADARELEDDTRWDSAQVVRTGVWSALRPAAPGNGHCSHEGEVLTIRCTGFIQGASAALLAATVRDEVRARTTTASFPRATRAHHPPMRLCASRGGVG